MSDDPDSEGGRIVAVEADGVTVEKTFERDEFPVPVVSFILSSAADDPVEIRLTDNIPESFEMEHVGFHPDFDSEKWTAYRDHRVEFVCTLDPGEEKRTVYGVRLDDEETIDDFLGEPTVERSDETEKSDPDDVLGRETNQLVRDALAGDDVPGVDGSLEPSDDDVAAALDDGAAADAADDDGVGAVGVEGEMDESDERVAEGQADGGGKPDGRPAPRSVASALSPAVVRAEGGGEPEDALVESVASSLAAELRAGNVDDDDVETLRKHLDASGPTSIPKSVEVRLTRLQSKIADLDAYTGALEEFLDENGTGEEIVTGFREDVETLEEEVAAVEDELADVRTTQTDLREDVDDVDAKLEERTEKLESSLEEQRTELADRLDTLQSDLESDVGAVDEDVVDLNDRVDALEADVSEFEAAEAEELSALESEVEELREDIENFRGFRDRMKNAFGE